LEEFLRELAVRGISRMAKKQLPYREGDWFAVPLRDGGYALGVAARVEGRGGVLGYFFGPRRRQVPTAEDTRELSAAGAILVQKFGDPGLLNGTWPILPRTTDWNRNDWPMPAFGTVFGGGASRREYDESTFSLLSVVPVTPEEASRLPEDSVDGYIALEIRLNRLLKPRRE
jgi:hypothetical protein